MLNKMKGGVKMIIKKVGQKFELKEMDRFQANHVYNLLQDELISEMAVFEKLSKELRDLNKTIHEFKKLLDKRV